MRTSAVVRLDASDELRSSGDHLLQEVLERVTEIGGHGLLGSRLGRQPLTVALFQRI